jgi:hypothetical protein
LLSPISAAVGALFALAQLARLSSVRVSNASFDADVHESLLGPESQHDAIAHSAAFTASTIQAGAKTYLRAQAKRGRPAMHRSSRVPILSLTILCAPSVSAFMALVTLSLFFLLGSGERFKWHWRVSAEPGRGHEAPAMAIALFSSVAFVVGASTSLLAGYVGMMIGCYANLRVAGASLLSCFAMPDKLLQ